MHDVARPVRGGYHLIRLEEQRESGRNLPVHTTRHIQQQPANRFHKRRPPARIHSTLSHLLPRSHNRGERQHRTTLRQKTHNIERGGTGNHGLGRRRQIAAQFLHGRNGLVQLVRLQRAKRRKHYARLSEFTHTRFLARETRQNEIHGDESITTKLRREKQKRGRHHAVLRLIPFSFNHVVCLIKHKLESQNPRDLLRFELTEQIANQHIFRWLELTSVQKHVKHAIWIQRKESDCTRDHGEKGGFSHFGLMKKR